MEDNDLFIHDATPTWGGFIYQGYIAIYLALKEISDLKESYTVSQIGTNYNLELENCEDIAIFRVDNNEYISIHQVKNDKSGTITKYRDPIIQLMLEKGFCLKKRMGNPKAYLHTSNEIKQSQVKNSVKLNDLWMQVEEYYSKLNQLYGIDNKSTVLEFQVLINNAQFNNWWTQIYEYYSKLNQIYDINNESTTLELKELIELIENEPLKLNRADYKNMLKELNDLCKVDLINYEKIKQKILNLIAFLKEKVCIEEVDANVNIYKYHDCRLFASADKVFEYIKEYIRLYRDGSSELGDLQVTYIADRLLHFMRGHVIRRHEAKQKKESIQIQIPFSEIISILDNNLDDYEREGNILALRRIYEKRLVEYCKSRCNSNTCLDDCNILDTEFMKLSLPDDKFVKFCYCLNPDCKEAISSREAINGLLNGDGLKECVFEIIKELPQTKFVSCNEENQFVVDNSNKNALVTAITNKCVGEVVEHIAEGINNNFDSVSTIFDSDQLITVNLDKASNVWENYFNEIETAWIQEHQNGDESITSSDHGNFCKPKQPEFVKVEQVIKIYNDGGN